ncbi:claudin domain-containing protein 2 isoform X3 [Ursus maritimus]|uniref:Claudin domain-containing protein 2 isoform X3 n=1 Tax=Ursus maritimus TaxID=29073 RepID=A0A8M1G282_URSMA|nr:claudin domain-containing protein 2 isoform X3 [Ursus maritimus]
MWEGVSRTGRTRERGLGTGGGLANLACVALGSSLPGMGVKRSLQSGGTLLGFLAKILTILSTATNYWIRYPGGHSGLWQECHGGTCSNIPCQSEARPAQMFPTGQTPPPAPAQTAAGTAAGHILRRPHTHPFHSSLRSTCSSATETTTNPHFGTYFPVATLTAPHGVTSKSPSKPSALLLAPYRRVGVVARGGASAGLRRPLSAAMLAVTGACMVLAVGSGIVGLVMGLRILCQEGDSRGQTTSGIFFLYGLLLLIALTGYTVKNAWKNDVFFSWSYFSGWLALPFSILAGFCFLLADMIVQSTDAISGFPVCL